MRPVATAWTVDTTMKCKRACGFCCSGAGPCGLPMPVKQFEMFSKDMYRAQKEGRIVVQRVGFTGGGEGLENEDLGHLAKCARSVCSQIDLVTSGAWDRHEEKRLEAFVRQSNMLNSVSVSVDPENPESLERLKRTLRCKLPKQITVSVRLWPDQKGTEMLEENQRRLLRAFQDAKCSVRRVEAYLITPYGVVAVDMDPEATTGRGTRVKVESIMILPLGKARIRLADQKIIVQEDLSCGLTTDGVLAVVHTMADGTLSWCCDCNKSPGIPMNHDGIAQLLSSRNATVDAVKSAFAGALGKEIYYPCDLCPFG